MLAYCRASWQGGLMARMPYQTDLTDQQWNELQPLIPPAKPGGRPRAQDMREVIDGILYVLRTGCAWRHLPHDLPNPKTCWSYFDRFSGDGTWRTIAPRRCTRRRGCAVDAIRAP